MKKLKAEMWDRVQYLFRSYYDGMTHAVFYYEDTLDIELLKEVYIKILEKTPIYHSSFKVNPIKPYWVVNDGYTAADFFEFVEATDLEGEINSFITTQIDYKSKCQLRVRVIRCDGKDTLCIVTNHMCADGGDFKAFNIKVAECYTKLSFDKHAELNIKTGTRSADQVYSTMSEEDKAIATKLKKNVSAVKSKVKFPFAPAKDDSCRINRYKVSAAEFLAVKAKGKAIGATINDVLLAAFIRAIYELADLKDGDLTVPCMCDLRRHIQGGATYGFTNLTGFMPCEILGGAGEDIFETVKKVKAALEYSKNDKFIGLYGLPLLKLAYTVFPQCIAQLAIKIGYQNPLIGMSNIGIIDAEAYNMNGIKLYDSWYTGAIKYKPYFQLACTTFKGEITMTAAYRGNADDDAIMDKFWQKIHSELKAFVE